MRPPRRFGPANGRDRWLVSYADFITLLFAFFTTMYAISTVDAAKLTSVANGLQHAFDEQHGAGVVGGGRGVLPAEKDLEARTLVRRSLEPDARAGRLELSEDARGMVISIPEAGAFGVGSATLSDQAQQVLGRLAAVLTKIEDPVRIEGHTDTTPIHTARFDSNWDLSTARATAVVQFLIEQGGLSPARLSAAGYGEFHPRADNDTPEGRARNRRVDIVVEDGAGRSPATPQWTGAKP